MSVEIKSRNICTLCICNQWQWELNFSTPAQMASCSLVYMHRSLENKTKQKRYSI